MTGYPGPSSLNIVTYTHKIKYFRFHVCYIVHKVHKTYGTVVPLSSEAVHNLTATAQTFRSVMEIRDLPEVFCQGS